uniref:Choline transporter-like protein n=1 Tax=Macrostomum lignano TaxID=282301 RepID=A0A1I8HNU3_9PLAT
MLSISRNANPRTPKIPFLAPPVAIFNLFMHPHDEPMTKSGAAHSYSVPILIMVFTYFCACLFLSVYNMGVDTMFLCFLEDLERNDGSAEKPYFMPESLMDILGKKNDPLLVKQDEKDVAEAAMETRLFGVKATSSMVFLSEMDFLVTIGLESPAPNQQRLSALLPLPSRWSQLSSSATRQFRMSFKPRLLNTLRICLVQASCRDSW